MACNNNRKTAAAMSSAKFVPPNVNISDKENNISNMPLFCSELPPRKRICLQNSELAEESPLNLTKNGDLDLAVDNTIKYAAHNNPCPAPDVTSNKQNLEESTVMDQEVPLDLRKNLCRDSSFEDTRLFCSITTQFKFIQFKPNACILDANSIPMNGGPSVENMSSCSSTTEDDNSIPEAGGLSVENMSSCSSTTEDDDSIPEAGGLSVENMSSCSSATEDDDSISEAEALSVESMSSCSSSTGDDDSIPEAGGLSVENMSLCSLISEDVDSVSVNEGSSVENVSLCSLVMEDVDSTPVNVSVFFNVSNKTKAISKKFKPPKPQNNFLHDAKVMVSKKSQIEKKLPAKKKTASADSPKNKISKKPVKRKPITKQQPNKVLTDLQKKTFISADSPSEMFSVFPELNKGIYSTEDSTAMLSEQSVSLLKGVTSTIDADDSSREVTSSADFIENTHEFPVLCKNKSSPSVSPAKKSSYRTSPAKKFSLQSLPENKSPPWTSPVKKTSPRSSLAKKSTVVKPMRSLTDAEYEEIFSSVINVCISTEDLEAQHNTTQVYEQSMELTNVSDEISMSLTKDSDKENETPKKKSKSNTSTPKNSQKKTVPCSPWGHHYAKQSQDKLCNELGGAGDPIENDLEEDLQVTNLSQATNVSLNSTSKNERLKLINSTPQTSRCHTSVEHSPWGHHYSKMRVNSQAEVVKPMRSLTDAEYEEIFSSVINVKDTSRCQEKSKSKKSQRFSNESEDMFDSSSSDSESVSSVSDSERYSKLQQPDSPRKIILRLTQSSQMPLPIAVMVTHRERLKWLHKQRNVGVWVQCMNRDCRAFRYLADIQDPLDVPDKWYCRQHPDVRYQACGKNMTNLELEEDKCVVESAYNAGSIVWAKIEGFPWWPAMVDDDTDIELYCWLEEGAEKPSFYNVVFFDSKPVTRSWVATRYIHKYKGYENCSKFQMSIKDKKDFRQRILEAKRQAADALTMPQLERLSKYSFIARYTGPINDPLTMEEEQKMKLKESSSKKTKTKKCSQVELKIKKLKKKIKNETIPDNETTMK